MSGYIFLTLGSRILDPGSWNPGSWILDTGSWILDRGSCIQDPGSQILRGRRQERVAKEALGSKGVALHMVSAPVKSICVDPSCASMLASKCPKTITCACQARGLYPPLGLGPGPQHGQNVCRFVTILERRTIFFVYLFISMFVIYIYNIYIYVYIRIY